MSTSRTTARSSSQPLRGGRLHHRELTADVVCGEWELWEALAHSANHVEVAERGLDHERVGALLDVEGRLAQRLACVARVHLMRPPIAERGRPFRRLSKRPVERGCVLDRVGEDRDTLEALAVERRADRADHAVDHPARRNDVRARLAV